MKTQDRKRDKKAERKVTFNSEVQTLMPVERTWNDFKTRPKERPMTKGTFVKQEMDELVKSLIDYAREITFQHDSAATFEDV